MSGDDGGRFHRDAANADHIWDAHRVTVGEAEEVFDDPRRFTRGSDTTTERRAITVGATRGGRVLADVTTNRNGKIRVVTAREGSKWEKQHLRSRK